MVIGGSGYSIYPKKLLELSGADFGIQGEGEASLVALVAALRGGGEWASIPGLVYRRDREIVANPQQASGSHTGLEAADRPSALADFYLTTSGMLNVQTQRGCEHACVYCAYPLIEGCLYRRRDPEAVANEFEQLQAMGAKYAFVVDSVFNSSERHVVETCEAILRCGVKLKWGCFLRPQSLTLEMMRLMARAGLTHIEFGSDSFCDSVLEQYAKRLAFDDIARSSELARQAGIERCHYLICGGPGETLETLETSFQHSRHLAGSVVLAVVGMRIFPGTALEQRAVRDGHIPADADLLAPAYYLAAGLDEVTVFEQLREFARRAPNWIVGDPPPGFAGYWSRACAGAGSLAHFGVTLRCCIKLVLKSWHQENGTSRRKPDRALFTNLLISCYVRGYHHNHRGLILPDPSHGGTHSNLLRVQLPRMDAIRSSRRRVRGVHKLSISLLCNR